MCALVTGVQTCALPIYAYKTTVFDLSRWRNKKKPSFGLGPEGPIMPERVIAKPPSAELRENQKDEDSLPPYEVLDPILYGLVEEELSVPQLVARGFEEETVARIERLLYVSEYKRRQAPPRSEEHTSELQSLMRISYAVFCLKKKKQIS